MPNAATRTHWSSRASGFSLGLTLSSRDFLNKKLFPEEKIIVTKHFDVHQDWEIPIPGFFIVASTRKISSIEEFTKEEAEAWASMMYICFRTKTQSIISIYGYFHAT